MVCTSVMVSPCVSRLSSDRSSTRRMASNVPESRRSIRSRRRAASSARMPAAPAPAAAAAAPASGPPSRMPAAGRGAPASPRVGAATAPPRRVLRAACSRVSVFGHAASSTGVVHAPAPAGQARRTPCARAPIVANFTSTVKLSTGCRDAAESRNPQRSRVATPGRAVRLPKRRRHAKQPQGRAAGRCRRPPASRTPETGVRRTPRLSR